MKKIMLVLPLLLALAGCLDNRPEQNPTGPVIKNSPTKEDLAKSEDEIKKGIATSQNAIQQNMQTLLGISVGKLSDDFLKAQIDLKDLLHAEISSKIGDIQNQMSASLASNNELRVMLKAQMDLNANLQATLTASVKANAQLQSMMDAKVSAIAAVASKIDTTTNETKQNLQAGHDVINQTQNFTKEVLQAIQSANRTNAWNTSIANLVLLGIIIAAAFVVCFVFNSQKKVALTMAKDAHAELKVKQDRLERVMAALPAHEADRIFPKSGQ